VTGSKPFSACRAQAYRSKVLASAEQAGVFAPARAPKPTNELCPIFLRSTARRIIAAGGTLVIGLQTARVNALTRGVITHHRLFGMSRAGTVRGYSNGKNPNVY
jgi:hypothetical protein